MKVCLRFCLAYVLVFLPVTSNLPLPTQVAGHPVDLTRPEALSARATVLQAYGKLPLHFEANHGQADPGTKFLTRGNGYRLLLTSTEAVLSLRSKSGEPGRVLRMKPLGANPQPEVRGAQQLAGHSNYFIGNDPAKWRTHVPHYANVEYREVYAGVDLVYYGNQRQIEYDFVVSPGADPGVIRLGFEGADQLRIDSQGDLILIEGDRELRQKKPVVYQDIGGARRIIDGRYALRGEQEVGFELGPYDPARELVIDPFIAYSTLLGGIDDEENPSITVDAAGNAYIVGRTEAGSWIPGPGFDTTFNGNDDVFVVKLNSTGSALIYATYLGGSGNDDSADAGAGIAIDASGNAYIAGHTASADFPTAGSVAAYDTSFNGSSDVFVAKLNSTGATLLYSTYIGGDGVEESASIALDATAKAYVAAKSADSGTNFPTVCTPSCTPYDSTHNGSDDLVVFKLDTTVGGAAGLIYSTFVGGSGAEDDPSIAVLPATGEAFVAANAFDGSFPTACTPACTAYDTSFNGLGDYVVFKLNAGGTALVYSTYLGGTDDEDNDSTGGAIAVDAAGNAYVVGETESSDFPTACTPSCTPYDATHNGGEDIFVTKLNAAGTALVYSTFIGGSATEEDISMALDAAGQVYVTAETDSFDLPTVSPVAVQIDTDDVYVAVLNAAGTALTFASYMGSGDDADEAAIAVDSAGNIYLAIEDGSDVPRTAGAFDTTSNGGEDFAIVKIAPGAGAACPHHRVHGHISTVPSHGGSAQHHGQHGHRFPATSCLPPHVPGHSPGLTPDPGEGLFRTAPAAAKPDFAATLNEGAGRGPAHRGWVVQLFGSAEGLYLDAQDLYPAWTFTAPASGSPLYYTTSVPEVRIAGQRARVLFSGLAPGLSGVWQINAVIPDGVVAGPSAVTITYEGQALTAVPMIVE